MSNLIVILFGLFCLFLMYDFNKNLERNNVKYNMTRGAYFVCLIPPIFILAIVALCGERQVRLESVFASLLSTFTSLSRTEFFHRLDVLMNIATNCMLIALAAAAIWTIYVSYWRIRKLKLSSFMTSAALIALVLLPYITIPILLLYSNDSQEKIEELEKKIADMQNGSVSVDSKDIANNISNNATLNSIKNTIAKSANQLNASMSKPKSDTTFIKLFPTNDQQYKAFYAYIVISLFGAFVSAYYEVYKGQEWFSNLFDMCTFIVSIYLLYCAGVIRILVKSFIGFMVSLFLIAIFPPIIVVLIPISIYYNRKKFEYLKKYSYYIWKFPLYLIVVLVISFALGSIIFKGDMIILATGAFTSVGTVLAMWLFMYQEQKKNIPFLTFYRNMWMVPTVFFLLLISFVVAHHSFDVVSDLESLDTLDSGNLDDNLTSNNYEVQSGENKISDNLNSTQSNFSLSSTSFNFSPIDGMNTVNTSNGFEIQGADGHTVLTVDNNAGIVKDHLGNQIASIQGNRLVDIHTGDTIVWRDETTGVYRDGLSQILNTENYGQGTFQSIKDVHGNGIDIINGELFDAKTHERIGNIHKV